jgi:hypothetical protein
VEAVGNVSDYAAINEYLGGNEFTVWDGILPYKFNADHSWPASDLPWAYGQIQDGSVVTTSFEGYPYVDYQGTAHEFVVPPWIQ